MINPQNLPIKNILQDITKADLAEEKVPLNNQDEATLKIPKEDKESQDVSLTVPLAESASDESKVIIPEQEGNNVRVIQESSKMTNITEKSIELLLKEKKRG